MNDNISPSSSKPQPASASCPPPAYVPYQAQDEEINLLDYWRVLTRYKVMNIVVTLLAPAAGIAIANTMTPVNRAEVMLAPVSEEEHGGLSALASQIAGIASLAGICLGSGGSICEHALSTLKARSF